MKHELRRVEPLRAANVSALVYGLMMAAFAVIFLPFILFMAMIAPPTGPGMGGAFFPVLFVVLYPVIGLIFGWIGGFLSAAIYNLIVRWTGGLLLEIAGPPIPTDIESGMV